MLKIALVEDDVTQGEYIISLVSQWREKVKIECSLKYYKSAEEFLFHYEDKSYDLLLADIQLGTMSGIDLAKNLRKQKDEIFIIFITGIKEYVFEGYDLEAINYLLKPVDKTDLFAALNKTCKKIDNRSNDSIILDGKFIRYRDILYIECIDHYLHLFLEVDKLVVKMTLGEIGSQLDQKMFFLCHRSFIVNLYRISQIEKDRVLMDRGQFLPVSRSKFRDLNLSFIDYHRNKLL